MTTGRPYTRAEYLAIKSAVRRACEDAGPLHSIAEHTRVDPPRLSAYGNPERPEFVPLDVAMDLDAYSGGDRILKAWAALRGYELMRNENGVAVEDTARQLGAVCKEVGEAINAIGDVAARPTPFSAARAEKEISQAKDVLDLAETNMRRIQAAG